MAYSMIRNNLNQAENKICNNVAQMIHLDLNQKLIKI